MPLRNDLRGTIQKTAQLDKMSGEVQQLEKVFRFHVSFAQWV
jgi:hypothetical protein